MNNKFFFKRFKVKRQLPKGDLSLTGFTLVESLFVVALIATLLAAMYPYLSATHTSWQSADRRSEAIQNARIGIDKMVRELRQARSFTSIAANSVTFEDADENAITYALNDGNIERNSVVLAGPVDSLAFNYYKDSGTSTTKESEVRLVKVSVELTYLEGKDPLEFLSMAYIRTGLGEGYLFSKNSNFSTSDTTFNTTDTFYINVWTDQVDYDNLDYATCQLKKGGTKVDFNLTNNGDGTYTGFQALTGFTAGIWTVNIDVKDNNTPAGGYKPTPAPTITII